jgi:phospholipid transport system substrate-binding protein
MMKIVSKLLAAIALLAFGTAQAADMAPDALVKETSQEVLAILKKDHEFKTNQNKILELVDAKVLPHFDFNRMTALAVGRAWRQATPTQQQTLVKEFRTLLVRTYSTSLSNYKNQIIDYKPLKMNPGDTDVTVRTQVVQPGGQPIPIDYSLHLTANGWKVYDVTVDNVSLVINYRGSFAAEIRKGGIDGLISALVQKNGGGAEAPAAPGKK